MTQKGVRPLPVTMCPSIHQVSEQRKDTCGNSKKERMIHYSDEQFVTEIMSEQ